ncbi:MAG TPA: glycosyltransferase family 1 protein [Candidatus Nitrosopolaris sp.]|nr:glycosyltransferase family 1 protein [Candidatus Nitrosopolaris sp.]
MSRKIRVLFDANPLARQKTGVGFFTEGIIQALTQIPELELVGHYFASRGPRPKLPKADNLSFTANPWVLGQFIKALRKVRIRLPWELLSWRKADVLFFPDFTTWPSLFRAPKILVIHDLTFIDCPQYVRKRNLHFLRRYVPGDARRADAILATSRYSKDRLIKSFGLPPEKIIVEPIPPPKPIAPKKRISLPAKFILFIGTIEPRKNIGGLVEAYRRLPEKLRTNYALVIAGGQGWDSDDVTSHIKRLQADGCDVVMTGYVDNAARAALYGKASLVALPSFYEGFGMPVLEAMSYGVPLVVSDLPVLREMVGSAVIYFNPSSVDSIKDALVKILTDDKLRENQVKKFPGLLKRYSWQTMAADLYKEIGRLAG